jgi:hypothetical protein
VVNFPHHALRGKSVPELIKVENDTLDIPQKERIATRYAHFDDGVKSKKGIVLHSPSTRKIKKEQEKKKKANKPQELPFQQ